jgi:GTPase SAR1 family protein
VVLKNASFFNLSETLTGVKVFLPAARPSTMKCKVVFCGPGGVGKTSLARRLVDEGFNPGERVDPRELSRLVEKCEER